MSAQLGVPASTSPMPSGRSLPDPLVSTRRLSRREIMIVVGLRCAWASGDDAAIAAAQNAVGPLWPALLALVDYRSRRGAIAWARITVAIDLLSEHAAVDAAARRQAKQVPKAPAPKLVAAKISPPPATPPRAPFRLGQSAGV
jgi:hypothetical protein